MLIALAHEMMSSLLRELAEEATMAATGECEASRVRRWAFDRTLDSWDCSVEKRRSSGKVQLWMVEGLFDARGERGMGASGFKAGLSASVSLLSEVQQKTESAKSGVLAPVILADPDSSAMGRVRGRGSTGMAGESCEVAAMLDLRAKGGRTLLLCLALRSLVMTRGGGGDCVAGNENALRSRGIGWDEEVGDPTSEAGGRGARGVMDSRLT